jgi:phage gpG-like protein
MQLPPVYLPAKNWLGLQHFNKNEMMEGVKMYMAELTGGRLL